MADKEIPKWRDVYPVLAPEDHDRLEANAAVHEFRGGHSKEEAESKAHQDYLKDNAINAAAHHYLGMRASVAANHSTAAKKHGAAYTLAMQHLGYNPLEAPPQDVLDRTKDLEKSPYSYKPHQADSFFEPKVEIPGVKEPTEEDKTLQLIEKLKSLRAGSAQPASRTST
jgi:hypothetical protein